MQCLEVAGWPPAQCGVPSAPALRLPLAVGLNRIALFCTQLGRSCLCVIECSGCACRNQVFCLRHRQYRSELAARSMLGPQSGAFRALCERDVLGKEVLAAK